MITSLGFDLGNHYGWSICQGESSFLITSGNEKLLTGKHKITHEFEGKRFELFEHGLLHKIERFKPTVLSIERPIGGPAMGGASAALFYGFRAICIRHAFKHSLKFYEVPTNTLKKFATGSGSNSVSKDQMREAAEKLTGKIILDHNEADAIHVSRWGFEQASK